MKNIKVYYLTMGFLFIANSVWATDRVGTIMTINEKRHFVHGVLLTDEICEKLRVWEKKHGLRPYGMTTRCKGYYIRLKVENNKLFITEMSLNAYSDKKGPCKRIVPLKEIFCGEGPIHATWVNEILIELF